MGVEDGGVVPTEGDADLRQRMLGQLAAEIHRDLSRVCDGLRAPLAGHVSEADIVVISNHALDGLDCHRFLLLRIQGVTKEVFKGAFVEFPFGKRSV